MSRVVACYLLLILVGIPWYWPRHLISPWLGVPLWVLVSLACGAAAAALTAWLFVRGGADSSGDPAAPGRH